MAELTQGALARLAFWAKNMTAIKDGGMEWPGFSYSDAEWTRFSVLAGAVSNTAYYKYMLVNALVFIVIAIAGIVAIFVPAAEFLFPVPAETSALKFALLLAGSALLIIGVGLQLSLRAAVAVCTSAEMRAQLVQEPGDADLAAKVDWQINRITLIMCGLLVPGIVIWVTYDINAGPIIAALKWIAIALMAISIGTGLRKQRQK
jgi:hypothetical protein